MMNEIESDLEILLDRLVDSDLEGGEYRRLLLDLEQQPDGWRRCALAFLQAQALRSELRAQPPPCIAHDSLQPASPVPSKRRRLVELLLAAAAGILVALPVGVLFPRSPEIARIPPIPSPASEFTENAGLAPDAETEQPGGFTEDWLDNYEWLLSEEGSAFPTGLARALESVGARIRRERGLLPLETPDGRRLMVPIERVELTPASFAQYR